MWKPLWRTVFQLVDTPWTHRYRSLRSQAAAGIGGFGKAPGEDSMKEAKASDDDDEPGSAPNHSSPIDRVAWDHFSGEPRNRV